MPVQSSRAVRFALLIAALALAGCAALLDDAGPQDAPDLVNPRQVIALLPDAQGVAQMRAETEAEGYRELRVTRLAGLGLTMMTYRMPDGVTGEEAIFALEAAVPSSSVGLNHAYRPQQAGAVRGLDYADGLMGWTEGACRAQMAIGMIDTAIDPLTPSLEGVRVETRQFFNGPAADPQHGTDVASILADPARLRDVTLYSANVFGGSGGGDLVTGAEALVRALDWLATEEVRLVNLALAGPYNKLLDLAVARASARGLILVAAVGNDGPAVEPMYPAGFDNAIAVTAVDVDRRVYRNAVRGPHVDVAAPGVDVRIRGAGGARFVTGTSIATPFVTARLAADPDVVAARNTDEVRALLARTSAELGASGRDPTFGFGLAKAEGVCGG
ncbi:S8 family serine peptidase [Dinoroseobacter sp. S375]|uniref:S8 family serine peptidase n=1 Tax=Dinoroseobacter sp. S375 TaxID=3415136 RepID=UPI003C7E1F51